MNKIHDFLAKNLGVDADAVTMKDILSLMAEKYPDEIETE